MEERTHGSTYAALWAFGLAFGWIEAATVLYLYELYTRAGVSPGGLQYPLASLPLRLIAVEVAREAGTLIILGAAGWLAGQRWGARIGAFLMLFGIWDLIYYLALAAVAGWPRSLADWDILFLIPLPWVAPVWAPALVAVAFVVCGSYLFWTDARPRAYSARDIALLVLSAAVIVVAFLVDGRLVFDPALPHRFPVWLFWVGVAGGVGWFARVEHRQRALRRPYA
jgi:hypothetical protein